MYIKQFKIKGNNINEIIEFIDDDLKIISYNPAEGVHIFMSEKYYLRTNGQLMASLIVNIEDEYNATVDVVTGGGVTGLFGGNWGTEKSRSKEIEAMIIEICENKAWDYMETR